MGVSGEASPHRFQLSADTIKSSRQHRNVNKQVNKPTIVSNTNAHHQIDPEKVGIMSKSDLRRAVLTRNAGITRAHPSHERKTTRLERTKEQSVARIRCFYFAECRSGGGCDVCYPFKRMTQVADQLTPTGLWVPIILPRAPSDPKWAFRFAKPLRLRKRKYWLPLDDYLRNNRGNDDAIPAMRTSLVRVLGKLHELLNLYVPLSLDIVDVAVCQPDLLWIRDWVHWCYRTPEMEFPKVEDQVDKVLSPFSVRAFGFFCLTLSGVPSD
jgi:hypothetical protein